MATAGINCGASSLHKTTQTKLCRLIFQKNSDSISALCVRVWVRARISPTFLFRQISPRDRATTSCPVRGSVNMRG